MTNPTPRPVAVALLTAIACAGPGVSQAQLAAPIPGAVSAIRSGGVTPVLRATGDVAGGVAAAVGTVTTPTQPVVSGLRGAGRGVVQAPPAILQGVANAPVLAPVTQTATPIVATATTVLGAAASRVAPSVPRLTPTTTTPPARGGPAPEMRPIATGNATALLSGGSRPAVAWTERPIPDIALGQRADLLTGDPAPNTLTASRALLMRYPRRLEADDHGEVVVRGEVLALAPSPSALAAARRLGFKVATPEAYPELEVTLIRLTAPKGLTAAGALRQLRALDPAGDYDLNPLFTSAGAAGPARPATAKSPAPTAGAGARIGMIDRGADVRHPSLAGHAIVQRGFAPGGWTPAAHGTATASLLVGRHGGFRGALPGAQLYAADVYGSGPTGGSTTAVIAALAWMARERVPVINVSLTGPPNAAMRAAIRGLTARGHVVVAAAGNDGPTAPPRYPAAYDGVVGVTGVDRARRVLPEAGRGPQVDFAAPGADMIAAGRGGYVVVRGTSFAAPLVAGRLARSLGTLDKVAADRAVAALAQEAVDLGARGPDTIYGQGLVGMDLVSHGTTLADGGRTGRP